ncbi:MAG: ABC transporter permease [Dehalococcoidia bacterium]|nr:ABC transporter permease [Dehalococcoidia bacterium]
MTRYIVRRLAMAVMILWFISIIVFMLLRVGGGDPALLQQGINATPEKIAQVHREMGLDDPKPIQYLHWIKGMLTLDFGRSQLTQTNITTEFRERFPVSFQLMLMTMFWTIALGIPAGVVSAAKRNSPADYVVRLFAIIALSVPAFWIATLVLLVPAQQWGYGPPLNRQVSVLTDPWDNFRQFGPPSLVLALGPIASVMRLTRSSLLEVLRADYVRTARAKGLSSQTVILRHALKNSLIPVVTVLGLLMGGLLGGSVIVEAIFNLRGLGAYVYGAILQKDYNVAQTLVMYTAGVAVLLNLGVDLLYSLFDPRIRYA